MLTKGFRRNLGEPTHSFEMWNNHTAKGCGFTGARGTKPNLLAQEAGLSILILIIFQGHGVRRIFQSSTRKSLILRRLIKKCGNEYGIPGTYDIIPHDLYLQLLTQCVAFTWTMTLLFRGLHITFRRSDT